MLKIKVITVHPQFIDSYRKFGPLAAAERAGSVSIEAINLRDYALDKHGTVDSRPFGGGEGMVLRAEPLSQAVSAIDNPYVVLPSPAGRLWKQRDAERFATMDQTIVLICGRFSGVDQRFVDLFVDEEISLGDFIISGGELAALVMIDSVVRHCPGALGDQESSAFDSFAPQLGGMLEYPLYTKPQVYAGQEVPPVLLSGNHKAIAEWRQEQILERTRRLRPDLLSCQRDADVAHNEN